MGDLVCRYHFKVLLMFASYAQENLARLTGNVSMDWLCFVSPTGGRQTTIFFHCTNFITRRFKRECISHREFSFYAAHMTIYNNIHNQIFYIWVCSFQWWCYIMVEMNSFWNRVYKSPHFGLLSAHGSRLSLPASACTFELTDSDKANVLNASIFCKIQTCFWKIIHF